MCVISESDKNISVSITAVKECNIIGKDKERCQ